MFDLILKNVFLTIKQAVFHLYLRKKCNIISISLLQNVSQNLRQYLDSLTSTNEQKLLFSFFSNSPLCRFVMGIGLGQSNYNFYFIIISFTPKGLNRCSLSISPDPFLQYISQGLLKWTVHQFFVFLICYLRILSRFKKKLKNFLLFL